MPRHAVSNHAGSNAVICEPVRTPIGRYGAMFRALSAVDLGVAALTGLLERTGVPAEAVDDVVVGHCYPNPEAPAIGRVLALDAGLPVSVGGMQVDRRCGSGLQAVIQACLQVSSGDHDLVIAGGVESMSNVAFYSTDMRWGAGSSGVRMHDGLTRGRVTAGGRNYPVPGGMLETAENLRRQYRISRAEQDELAAESHRRTVAAQRSGVFAEEIIPVTVSDRSGERVVDTDEHPRADTTVEALARLKPILAVQDPEATVTAGNSSGQNDAAFAAQALAVMREWNFTGADRDRTNIHGSGISLGHPVGATGGRMLAGLARELHRRNGRYGLETMCIGGGQGLAAVFERLS